MLVVIPVSLRAPRMVVPIGRRYAPNCAPMAGSLRCANPPLCDNCEAHSSHRLVTKGTEVEGEGTEPVVPAPSFASAGSSSGTASSAPVMLRTVPASCPSDPGSDTTHLECGDLPPGERLQRRPWDGHVRSVANTHFKSLLRLCFTDKPGGCTRLQCASLRCRCCRTVVLRCDIWGPPSSG